MRHTTYRKGRFIKEETPAGAHCAIARSSSVQIFLMVDCFMEISLFVAMRFHSPNTMNT